MNYYSAADMLTHWRQRARWLLANHISPENTHWDDNHQAGLFADNCPSETIAPETTVPKAFLQLAKTVACYRDEQRWPLLYRVLWRLAHDEPWLLDVSSDGDIHQLLKMEKAVRRDSHKMKAFVRFKKALDKDDTYIAWHQPSHYTLERTAPFFVRRFTTMRWVIFTPDISAYWNGEQLHYGEGVPRSATPANDELEELWKTFYWHIFNPARIKVSMMKSEMPMKFWHTLPEAQLIPEMLRTASKRIK